MALNGNKRQLLMSDNAVVASSSNFSAVVNAPTKQGVIITPTASWETTDEGLLLPGAQWYDASEKLYKMTAVVSVWPTYTSPSRYPELFESADGLNWTRPSLNLVEFPPGSGTYANNLIQGGEGLVEDPLATPDKRYKQLGTPGGQTGIWWRYSADGRSWSAWQSKLLNFSADGDCRVLYLPWRNAYYAYCRAWYQTSEVNQRPVFDFGRVVVWIPLGSNPWTTWTFPAGWTTDSWICDSRTGFNPRVMTPADTGAASNVNIALKPWWFVSGVPDDDDPYGPGIFVYDGLDLLIATPSTLDQDDQHLDGRLAYSRDGETWVQMSGTYLPRGSSGQADSGAVWMSPHVLRVGNDLYHYYVGWNGGDHLHYVSGSTTILRAKQRLDGFISQRAGGTTGTLTTQAISFVGERLKINCRPTTGGGWVKVAVCDGNGVEIAGFGLSDAVSITADSVENVCAWSGNPDLSRVAKPVKLKIQANNAEVFSFVFTNTNDCAHTEVTPSKTSFGVGEAIRARFVTRTASPTFSTDGSGVTVTLLTSSQMASGCWEHDVSITLSSYATQSCKVKAV